MNFDISPWLIGLAAFFVVGILAGCDIGRLILTADLDIIYQGGHAMQLSNELFFALFSIVMVVAVIWLMRSVSRYKTRANSLDEKNMDG